MINDKKIDIIINPKNREKYQDKLNISLINGQTLTINQFEMLETSRLEVECTCDICSKVFMKKRVAIKSDTTLCGIGCRNELMRRNNPNPTKEKVEVDCFNCGKKFLVFESKSKKQDVFLCGRECYKEHRSKNYSGDNIYNYQNQMVPCANCDKPVKTSKWYSENKKNRFCTPECYWKHRKNHYKEFYYKSDLNDNRDETNPERIVREFLEDRGLVKDKDFLQECGFLRKYFVDFFLPDSKTIIEVYGDYWHVNPEIYDINGNEPHKKPLHNNQREFIESKYDEIRVAELESHGFKVHIFWENEIKKDVHSLFENLPVNVIKNP